MNLPLVCSYDYFIIFTIYIFCFTISKYPTISNSNYRTIYKWSKLFETRIIYVSVWWLKLTLNMETWIKKGNGALEGQRKVVASKKGESDESSSYCCSGMVLTVAWVRVAQKPTQFNVQTNGFSSSFCYYLLV